MTIQFDKDGFALEDGTITVYIADQKGIYSHTDSEFVSVGTGLSAGAYLDTPPEAKSGFAIVRTSTGWEYKPDHRGETVYSTIDQSTVEITELGDYPENTTPLKPACDCHVWDGEKWVLDKTKANERKTNQQASIWEQIKAKRYTVTHGGVYVDSVKKWFHSDEPSRIQYLSIQQLESMPENLNWKTMDNSFVVMTKELLSTVILQIIAQEQAAFASAEKHRLAMLASDEALNYDFSSGWSAIYE